MRTCKLTMENNQRKVPTTIYYMYIYIYIYIEYETAEKQDFDEKFRLFSISSYEEGIQSAKNRESLINEEMEGSGNNIIIYIGELYLMVSPESEEKRMEVGSNQGSPEISRDSHQRQIIEILECKTCNKSGELDHCIDCNSFFCGTHYLTHLCTTKAEPLNLSTPYEWGQSPSPSPRDLCHFCSGQFPTHNNKDITQECDFCHDTFCSTCIQQCTSEKNEEGERCRVSYCLAHAGNYMSQCLCADSLPHFVCETHAQKCSLCEEVHCQASFTYIDQGLGQGLGLGHTHTHTHTHTDTTHSVTPSERVCFMCRRKQSPMLECYKCKTRDSLVFCDYCRIVTCEICLKDPSHSCPNCLLCIRSKLSRSTECTYCHLHFCGESEISSRCIKCLHRFCSKHLHSCMCGKRICQGCLPSTRCLLCGKAYCHKCEGKCLFCSSKICSRGKCLRKCQGVLKGQKELKCGVKLCQICGHYSKYKTVLQGNKKEQIQLFLCPQCVVKDKDAECTIF